MQKIADLFFLTLYNHTNDMKQLQIYCMLWYSFMTVFYARETQPSSKHGLFYVKCTLLFTQSNVHVSHVIHFSPDPM